MISSVEIFSYTRTITCNILLQFFRYCCRIPIVSTLNVIPLVDRSHPWAKNKQFLRNRKKTIFFSGVVVCPQIQGQPKDDFACCVGSKKIWPSKVSFWIEFDPLALLFPWTWRTGILLTFAAVCLQNNWN